MFYTSPPFKDKKISGKKLVLFSFIFIFSLFLMVSFKEVFAASECYDKISGINRYERCKVDNGTSLKIYAQGCTYDCKVVTNNTGAHIFVPTKTCNEWDSFLNNYPQGITISACTTTSSLSCDSSTQNSITLRYSFSDSASGRVSIFRGTRKIKTFSGSSGSGTYTDSGRSPDTSYTYYLRDGTSNSSPLLDSTRCRTTRGEDGEAPFASLECTRTSRYSIAVDYRYSNVTGRPSLFRDNKLLATFSGDPGSGSYGDAYLAPNTSYTYTLRNWPDLQFSTVLARATCRTTGASPTGHLSCVSSDRNSILLDVSYQDTVSGEVSLFRGNKKLTTFSSSSVAPFHYRDGSLSPGTSYRYYLRDGSSPSSPILASAQCGTKK